MRVNIPNVVHETIDGETILLNLKTGNYYSFEGLGAFIWNYIDNEAGWTNLPELLADTYGLHPDLVMNDVSIFVERLVEEHLVIEEPLSISLGAEKAEVYRNQIITLGSEYLKPIVNKYSDMQDLLLLDPIHDVDHKGWPEQKKS